MKGLSKHRYYELLHWCLQYPEWEDRIRKIKFLPEVLKNSTRKSKWIANRSTEDLGSVLADLTANRSLVERVCNEASSELYPWLLMAVTRGTSFNELKMVHGLPCEKDMFYDRRRRFFILLDKEK